MTTVEDATQARLDAVTPSVPPAQVPVERRETLRVHFPATSDERIVLLATFLVSGAIFATSLVQVGSVASGAGMSLSALLEQSQTLRMLVFLLALLWVLSSLAGWVYARFRGATRLELGPELLRFEQPGLPLFGALSNSLVVAWDRVDRVRVRRVRRGLTMSSELQVEAGRDLFRVNLDRAKLESGPPLARARGRSALREHPVVRTIAERSGRSPEE